MIDSRLSQDTLSSARGQEIVAHREFDSAIRLAERSNLCLNFGRDFREHCVTLLRHTPISRQAGVLFAFQV